MKNSHVPYSTETRYKKRRQFSNHKATLKVQKNQSRKSFQQCSVENLAHDFVTYMRNTR